MILYREALNLLRMKWVISNAYKQPTHWFFKALLLIICTFPSMTFATDIYELRNNRDVEILAWVGEKPKAGAKLEPEKVSVNEQVILTIEVATPRWLTGGTRIGSIDIPNVIAKQRNQLATNYTERVGGTTWSRQRWEVTIYPQTEGKFVIPRIPVGVQVSAPDGSNVAGTLYTQSLQFEAFLPSGLLSDKSPWFSASYVNIEQQWQRSNEELKVGDAITRTVMIRAKDSLSVLLPNVLTNESTQQYQVYPQPNRLDDTQERGDYRSSRVEESVYVIQQGGEFALPEFSFQWWNSKNQRLESIVVEGQTFKARHTLKSFLKAYMHVFIFSVIGLVTFISSLFATKRYYRNRPTPSWLVFRRLLKAGNWPKIRTFIYKQLRIATSELELSKVKSKPNWQDDAQKFQSGTEDNVLAIKVSRGIRAYAESKALDPNLYYRTALHRPWNLKYLRRWRFPKALADLKDKST